MTHDTSSISTNPIARPLYIFDLDGTLARIEHRVPILANMDDSHRWQKFYDACDKDEPNEPVIRLMETLRRNGADVWIFSGRGGEVRDKTVAWLAHHTTFCSWELATALMMREVADYTPDDKLKKDWLDRMLVDDRDRLVAAFDDRDRVVRMWRDSGVTCFQVAPGEF